MNETVITLMCLGLAMAFAFYCGQMYEQSSQRKKTPWPPQKPDTSRFFLPADSIVPFYKWAKHNNHVLDDIDLHGLQLLWAAYLFDVEEHRTNGEVPHWMSN